MQRFWKRTALCGGMLLGLSGMGRSALAVDPYYWRRITPEYMQQEINRAQQMAIEESQMRAAEARYLNDRLAELEYRLTPHREVGQDARGRQYAITVLPNGLAVDDQGVFHVIVP